MTGGDAVHEQQAILSTMVVISINLYGACQHDPIMQVGHGEANFIFPLCNYRYILLPLLLDPSDYSLVQRPVPLHHQYVQHLLWGITPTYSFVGQEQRLYIGIFSAVFMIA